MESMDFVIELTDKLKKQNIDYFLFTVRKKDKKENQRGDVFYNLTDEDSIAAVMTMMHKLGRIEKDNNESTSKTKDEE
tara:strand:- start:1720 stop:1953 length:234 start_codon:yes stop_codon:yes gene_type:complete